MRNVLAMPVIVGRKTVKERFAGAANTMTCEAIMRDGKALQMGTSHELGQRFSRAFNIGYSTADGTTEHCWTTSWGASTRMLGGLIMCHGDDFGLVLPPALAPVQAVVVVVKDDRRQRHHGSLGPRRRTERTRRTNTTGRQRLSGLRLAGHRVGPARCADPGGSRPARSRGERGAALPPRHPREEQAFARRRRRRGAASRRSDPDRHAGGGDGSPRRVHLRLHDTRRGARGRTDGRRAGAVGVGRRRRRSRPRRRRR